MTGSPTFVLVDPVIVSRRFELIVAFERSTLFGISFPSNSSRVIGEVPTIGHLRPVSSPATRPTPAKDDDPELGACRGPRWAAAKHSLRPLSDVFCRRLLTTHLVGPGPATHRAARRTHPRFTSREWLQSEDRQG